MYCTHTHVLYINTCGIRISVHMYSFTSVYCTYTNVLYTCTVLMHSCTMYILYTYACTVNLYSCIHVLHTYTCTVLSNSLYKKCSIHYQKSVKLFVMSAYCRRTIDRKCLNNHLLLKFVFNSYSQLKTVCSFNYTFI